MSNSRAKSAIKATVWSIIGNVVLASIKWIFGYFGNSYALIADAIESTSDIFGSFLVLLGLKYAHRPADKNHPYGHGRAEPLIVFLVVGFLIVSATIIAWESIHNIQKPHDLPKPFTLWFLAGVIVWKEISYRWMKRKSMETGSSSLEADAWHHRSDAITSLAAFIGISIAISLGKGYESADDWAALFASGFIFYNSYLILRPALGELMDEHRYPKLESSIRTHSMLVQGVLDTEKCFIRKAGMNYLVDLHISVNGNLSVGEGHEIAHRLKSKLMELIPELSEVMIHVEPHEQSGVGI
jgi:cation diffusion facilitator family transporter